MIDIIHSLRRTSSRNEKIKILKKHEDNYLWHRYLEAVYNPYVNYYITSVADTTFYTPIESLELNIVDMLEYLPRLSNREYTGHDARDFANMLSRQYGELFRLILKRSIDAGITANTINKVYPGLIATFTMMKGKEREVDEFPCWVSTKYDGARVLARVENGDVRLHSSSGKNFPLESLEQELSIFQDGWYDGELVTGDGNSAGRTSITGYLNRLLKGTATDIIDEEYHFMVFDYVKLSDWDSKHCIGTYRSRLDFLNIELLGCVIAKPTPQLECESQLEINEIYDDLVERGYEGIIVRWMDDFYEWNTPSKRSKRLVKKKEKREVILKCVDTIEGEGKYQGMIGSLICEGIVEGKFIEVNVGSGLSDYDREQDPDYFLNKDVEIIYNSVVSDSNGYSLFLPRLKRRVGDV